jgi:type I restriction enzyme S subunit
LECANSTLDRTEESITPEGLRAIRGRLFPEGTLLLAMYGSVGKVAVAGIELATNQAILGIRALDGAVLDTLYLRRWLTSIQPKLVRDARGVTQQNISATMVRDLRITLPPLADQRRIAAVLNNADAIRRKRRESIKLLDEFLRSAFLKMFGDPVRNEKGWQKGSIGDVFAGKQYGTGAKANR